MKIYKVIAYDKSNRNEKVFFYVAESVSKIEKKLKEDFEILKVELVSKEPIILR